MDRANKCIECTVKQCANHAQNANYCSLDRIMVGSHECNPTQDQCTDCLSFRKKLGSAPPPPRFGGAEGLDPFHTMWFSGNLQGTFNIILTGLHILFTSYAYDGGTKLIQKARRNRHGTEQ